MKDLGIVTSNRAVVDQKRGQSFSFVGSGADFLKLGVMAAGIGLLLSFKKESSSSSSGSSKKSQDLCAQMVFDRMDKFYNEVRSTEPEFPVDGNRNTVYSYETLVRLAEMRNRGLKSIGFDEARDMVNAFEELNWTLVFLAKRGFVLKNIWKSSNHSTAYITPAMLAYRVNVALYAMLWSDPNDTLRNRDASKDVREQTARIASEVRFVSQALFDEAVDVLTNSNNAYVQCDLPEKYLSTKAAGRQWVVGIVKPSVADFVGPVLVCLNKDEDAAAGVSQITSLGNFCRNYEEATKWARALLEKGATSGQEIAQIVDRAAQAEREYFEDLGARSDATACGETKFMSLCTKAFRVLTGNNVPEQTKVRDEVNASTHAQKIGDLLSQMNVAFP